jgi:hypothetical protein
LSKKRGNVSSISFVVFFFLCYKRVSLFLIQSMIVILARGERMKEAKSEAEAIVAAYRAEMESNYQQSSVKVGIFIRDVFDSKLK